MSQSISVINGHVFVNGKSVSDILKGNVGSISQVIDFEDGSSATIITDTNEDGEEEKEKVLHGNGNMYAGSHKTIIGNSNKICGSFCKVHGNDNTVNGSFCKVYGDRNVVNGSHCKAFGSGNKVTGSFCKSKKKVERSCPYERKSGKSRLVFKEDETYLQTQFGKDEPEEDSERACPICVINKPVLTGECGHVLCFSCAKKLVDSCPIGGFHCPLCRTQIKKKMTRVFM